jgi:putative ABC transport system permease protein
MKTLGFRPFHLIGLIGGESLVIALGGFVLGLFLTSQVVSGFANFLVTANLSAFFPVFELKNSTITLSSIAAVAVGLASAIFPAWRAVKMRIADGLHRIG